MPEITSPNFSFLKKVNPLLVEVGARAEAYALTDPVTSMMKSRQMGELLQANNRALPWTPS